MNRALMCFGASSEPEVHSAWFTSGGKLMALASSDKTVLMWQVAAVQNDKK